MQLKKWINQQGSNAMTGLLFAFTATFFSTVTSCVVTNDHPLIETVRVPGGTFQMGDAAIGPIHKVTVSSYRIGRTEVTQAQYQAVTGMNPSYFQSSEELGEIIDAPSRPVENVSWFDAVDFCNRLSAREGLSPAYTIMGTNVTLNSAATGYRLPTEAEWEYAARGAAEGAGEDLTFAGNNDFDNVAWCVFNSDEYVDRNGGYRLLETHPVGLKKSNRLGLYDMSGNVTEWCYDWYDNYPAVAVTDPVGSTSGMFRIVRGGGSSSEPYSCAVKYRSGNAPNRTEGIGFRVVLPAGR